MLPQGFDLAGWSLRWQERVGADGGGQLCSRHQPWAPGRGLQRPLLLPLRGAWPRPESLTSKLTGEKGKAVLSPTSLLDLGPFLGPWALGSTTGHSC